MSLAGTQLSLLRTVTFPVPPSIENLVPSASSPECDWPNRWVPHLRVAAGEEPEYGGLRGDPKNGFNFGNMERGMNSPVRRREFWGGLSPD